MDIEDFMDQWIDGQCRKFAAEIEETDALLKFLSDVPKRTQDPKRCYCGDWSLYNNGTCGPNGCYNRPA